MSPPPGRAPEVEVEAEVGASSGTAPAGGGRAVPAPSPGWREGGAWRGESSDAGTGGGEEGRTNLGLRRRQREAAGRAGFASWSPASCG